MSIETLARLILSAIIVLGFGSVLSAYIIWPPDKNELVASMLTVLGVGYTTVIYYWFTRTEGPKS